MTVGGLAIADQEVAGTNAGGTPVTYEPPKPMTATSTPRSR